MTPTEFNCRREWHKAAAASFGSDHLISGADWLARHMHQWLSIYCDLPDAYSPNRFKPTPQERGKLKQS